MCVCVWACHCYEAADEAEVGEVVGVDGRGRVDLQTVVAFAGVLEQAVHGVQHFMGQEEKPLSAKWDVGKTQQTRKKKVKKQENTFFSSYRFKFEATGVQHFCLAIHLNYLWNLLTDKNNPSIYRHAWIETFLMV